MRGMEDKEIRQEWIKPLQAARFCGVSRALIHAWMNKGLIRNVELRQRGQIRATRLISFDSLRDFLESRAKGGQVAE
jgi:hypothetical protein